MWTFIAFVLLGWASGVLVNYLSEVLPYKRRLSVPFCLVCGKSMSYVNFFLYPRKCQYCNKLRPSHTWIVEGIYIIAIVLIGVFPSTRVEFFTGLLLLIYFGVITSIDIQHRVILHQVSLTGVVIGTVIGIQLHGVQRTFIGGVVGFSIMLVFYSLGVLLKRYKNRKAGVVVTDEPLGFGDVNLSGVIGLILGWPAILAGLIITIFSAGSASLIYLLIMIALKRYRANLSIPYGPFLVFGVMVLLFFT